MTYNQLSGFPTLPILLLASLTACSDRSDADYRAEVALSMHDAIAIDLADLVQAARDLQSAAPTHAWNATADLGAITQMREAWKRARIAYEHVEGATAPIFADLDVTLDARYDDYLALLGPAGDQALFDGNGVTGMHGIERILFAPAIRPEVIAFERTLPGYKAAAYPATEAEAMAFKTELVQKLYDDTRALHDQWQPAAIDIGAAYQGLVGLMNEQKEKVNLAATGEEESRYANLTLFDLRNNLDGTRKVYETFRPWITTKPAGADADARIEDRFTALTALYGSMPGDSLPVVPDDWSSDQPTPGNLATPFGALWKTVREDVDPNSDGSVVFEMNQIAVLLGFPEFVEQ
ncbi:MAG TPA: EfeM/EfeO family lipoprotein [Kofleriaceae bacterium]|jgi:iron uptake system component EfeO|nr:EfeM/EfeO family lipoprotein [Kofleriaceae bacterium]